MKRMHPLLPLAGLALALMITTQPAIADPDARDLWRVVVRTLVALDTDADGQLSLEEFVAARLARTERRFARRDRDGDGILSEADFYLERPEPPTDFDRDAFRVCLAEKLDMALPPVPEPGSRLAAVDLDGDGAVSLEEALIASEDRAVERFDAADTDDDGFIARAELRGRLLRAARVREARRECREEQQAIAAVLGF